MQKHLYFNQFLSYMNNGKGKYMYIFSLILIVFLFYYRVFIFYHLFMGWHNFYINLPGTTYIYPFWNPYYDGGSPIITPITNFEGEIVLSFFENFLGLLLGYIISVKLYMFASFIFFILSFFIMLKEFTDSYLSRTFASLFLFFNPSIFVMAVYGDFAIFYAFGAFFLSLLFLTKYLKKQTKEIYLLISILFLVFTLPESQIFYLAIVLYLFYGIYFIIFENRDSLRHLAKFIAKYFIFLITASLAFLLPFFLAAPVSVLPSGPVARSLSFYISSSTNINKLILLSATGTTELNSVSVLGHIYPEIWFYSLIILIFLIILFSIVSKNKFLYFILSMLILAVLFGSGARSPINFITIWMYKNVPGYQLFPESYLWDEVIIAPLYAISIAVILDIFIKKKTGTLSKINNRQFRKIEKIYKNKNFLKIFAVIMIFLIVIISVLPIMSQGYYNGPNGINTCENNESYLTNFIGLNNYLKTSTENSDKAVAFFPGVPDVYYGNNTGSYICNVLMDKPAYRTIDYQGGTPSQNNFYYSIYCEFYNNQTKFMPELLSLVGVKYFVVLNNLTGISSRLGAGENITKLMQYQDGIKELKHNKYYELYETTFNLSNAEIIKNLTLVIGKYSALNYINYIGINITKTPIIFSSDINKADSSILIPYIDRIVSTNYTLYNNFIENLSRYASTKESSQFINDINTGKINLLEIVKPTNIKVIYSSYYNLRNYHPSGYSPEFLYLSNRDDNQSKIIINSNINTSYIAIATCSYIENHNFTIDNKSLVPNNYINNYTKTYWTSYNNSISDRVIHIQLDNDTHILYSQSWIKFILISNKNLNFTKNGLPQFKEQDVNYNGSTLKYTATGYDIKSNYTGLLLVFIPYFSDMISHGGSSYSALGGMVSIISISSKAEYSSVAYSYYLTVYGIIIAIIFFTVYFALSYKKRKSQKNIK